MLRWLNTDGDGLGDLTWKTERSERLWIATGPPLMQTTSRRNTRFTKRTRCSNIRNRTSASAGGGRFSRLAGELWVTEFVITYDGQPSYTVSIMEFLDGKVARETQYFGDPFEPGPSRAQWVERMP
jgi:hypothetical protein